MCKVLYIFAGEKRQGTIGDFLQQRHRVASYKLDIQEVDILQDRGHDVAQIHVQQALLKSLAEGKIDVLVITPPCSTWSRVRVANLKGPPPLRDYNYPWGYPWLAERWQTDLKLGNLLVLFTIEALRSSRPRR